jgi:hypothetical protein
MVRRSVPATLPVVALMERRSVPETLPEEVSMVRRSVPDTLPVVVPIRRRSVPETDPLGVAISRKSVPAMLWTAARIEAIKLASCAAFDCIIAEPVPDMGSILDALINNYLMCFSTSLVPDHLEFITRKNGSKQKVSSCPCRVV